MSIKGEFIERKSKADGNPTPAKCRAGAKRYRIISLVGEMNSRAFGSPKFFNHLEIVDDDPDNSFKNLVSDNYDSRNGYFTSAQFEEPITVRPYLLKFVQCTEEKCDCRDDSSIQKDIHNYLSGLNV